MATGTVKFFNEEKGYGFIKPEGGGKDVFVHISDLQRSDVGVVGQGDSLEFEISNGRDGRPKAVNLAMSVVD